MKNKKVQPEVQPAAYPDPPTHLSERAASLWRSQGPRCARSSDRQALLEMALAALDRATEAGRIVEAEGLCIRTKSGSTRMHPATRIENEARIQFARLWKRLGLGQYSR